MRNKNRKPISERVNDFYLFAVRVPAIYSPREMADYVRVAVKQWRKGGDPADDFYHIDDREFTVSRIPTNLTFSLQDVTINLQSIPMSGDEAEARDRVIAYLKEKLGN